MTETDAGRPPHTLGEHVTANCRPQPAIPAVIVMLPAALLPLLMLGAPGNAAAGWLLWLIGAAFLGSAALAIAAGFCSLAPQLIWLMLALWARSLIERAGAPDILLYTLYLCAAAVIAMIGVQLWRIATRRFVPTVRDTVRDAEAD